MPSVVLMVVGLGLNAAGWLIWDSYWGNPLLVAWLLWLTGAICWIVSASLSWKRINKVLGTAVQVVGFVGLCVAALGFLVGSFSLVGHFIVAIGLVTTSAAIGIWTIPRALRH